MNRRDVFRMMGGTVAAASATAHANASPAGSGIVDIYEKLSPKTIDFYRELALRKYQRDFQELVAHDEQLSWMRDRGARLNRELKLANTLNGGGVLTFPHVHIGDCGHLTSAVVDACFAADANHVLVVSLMHALNEGMMNAFFRVAAGGKPEDEPLRGIYGPGLPENPQADTWKRDHVLFLFRKLVAIEAERRNIEPPAITERFVFLAGPDPETLPGFEELKALAKDAIVVSSADHAHHGIGYGTPIEDTYPVDERGLRIVREEIMTGLRLLDTGDYAAYQQHCFGVTHSDWESAGVVIRALKGPTKSTILDMGASDFSNLFGEPRPTWVASALLRQELV